MEQFILVIQIDQGIDDAFSDSDNLETQKSNTSFGNWRQSDEDDCEKGIKGE